MIRCFFSSLWYQSDQRRTFASPTLQNHPALNQSGMLSSAPRAASCAHWIVLALSHSQSQSMFITWLYLLYSLSVLSHQQHLVCTKQVRSLGSVRLRWCECNHLTLVHTKSAGRDLPEEGVSVCFQTNPDAVRLRCESERTSVRCSSIRLFGGNYFLISGNSD